MVASAGLVGRSTVLDELVGLVERARSGGAQLVVVEGEAGIGKSILADALGDAAGRRGFRVLRAAADELSGRQSFGLIAGFLGARWLFEPADVLDTRGEEPALPGYGPRRPGAASSPASRRRSAEHPKGPGSGPAAVAGRTAR
jgi:hypothetical protein